MGLGLPTYRVTAEDLVDAEKKTARALGPLLDALNLTLSRVISALNTIALPNLKAGTFTTAENGAAYVDLGLSAPATELWVTSITPQGGTLDSVWSMAWIPRAQGARLLFDGLAPLTTYAYKVRFL